MVDIELEILKRRKMEELKRRLATTSPATKEEEDEDPIKTLNKYLADRGGEVLEAARVQYPTPTMEIARELVKLIKLGNVKEPITGEVLYSTFRAIGLRVRLDTKIVFEKHGEVKSLSQKLKENITD